MSHSQPMPSSPPMDSSFFQFLDDIDYPVGFFHQTTSHSQPTPSSPPTDNPFLKFLEDFETADIPAKEILLNVKRLEDGGRIHKSAEGISIDIAFPRYLNVDLDVDCLFPPEIIEEYFPGYKRVSLTGPFWTKLMAREEVCEQMVLTSTQPWRQKPVNVVPVLLDLKTVLISCGMGHRFEQYRLEQAKFLTDLANPCFPVGYKPTIHPRFSHGLGLIIGGIFENWEEIEAYEKIQELIDPCEPSKNSWASQNDLDPDSLAFIFAY